MKSVDQPSSRDAQVAEVRSRRGAGVDGRRRLSDGPSSVAAPPLRGTVRSDGRPAGGRHDREGCDERHQSEDPTSPSLAISRDRAVTPLTPGPTYGQSDDHDRGSTVHGRDGPLLRAELPAADRLRGGPPVPGAECSARRGRRSMATLTSRRSGRARPAPRGRRGRLAGSTWAVGSAASPSSCTGAPDAGSWGSTSSDEALRSARRWRAAAGTAGQVSFVRAPIGPPPRVGATAAYALDSLMFVPLSPDVLRGVRDAIGWRRAGWSRRSLAYGRHARSTRSAPSRSALGMPDRRQR